MSGAARVPPARPFAAAALALALAGCPGGEQGTITIGLTTAPGSTVMDGATRLRVTFTSPRQEILVERSTRGFDLSLDLEAVDALNSFIIEAEDAAGALVASGMSPPFPLSALDGRIVIYMAPPLSVGAAPVALDPPRAQPGIAPLSYGAILAGGVTTGGEPSAALQIYNAYDHSLATGLPLLAPRAAPTLAVATGNQVFVFGGAAPGGAPAGALWTFDTTVQPAGRYLVTGDFPQFARAGALAVPTGGDRFRITGAPAIELAASQLAEPGDLPAISSGAAVTGADRVTTAVVVDATSGTLRRIRGNGAPEPLAAQRKGGAAVALPDDRLAVLGGDADPTGATLIDAVSGALTPVPAALSAAYASLAVAGTPRFVVAAGAAAGATSSTVEILDAATLAPRAAIPVDDAITSAIALPNEQVLLVGGRLHLFTPPPPPRP